MLRARVAVWAGPRGGYARIAVLPILRGLLPNPPMLPKRDTDCAGVASRREGVADRRHATPGGAFSSRICSVGGDTEECVNSPQSLLGATRRCCAGHASIDPKLNAPASPPPMVPKKCAIQSRTQWIEEIVALIPYDDNHDQAEDYPEYFLSGEDSFVAVYLPCRIFFRRRWRPRTGCATLEMPLKNSVAHRQSAKPSRHT